MNPDAIRGCLLGTAVGDALGLPYEGISPRRAARLFPDPSRYHFLFSKGMVSDDTEHTCMVAQALIDSAGDVEGFARELAGRLRFWLLGLPAGIGFATLRAIVRLWLGFSSDRSGVFSAGNGPAMRAAIIGVSHGRDSETLKGLVRSATVITHTDPKAYYGALAVSLAAHLSATGERVAGHAYCGHLERLLQDQDADEFLGLIQAAVQSAEQGCHTTEFVQSLGLRKGITGYVYHTVPAVIHAWLINPKNFPEALLDIISCGGDTDTTGAILGGIVGAAVGKQGIPEKWLKDLVEWPRTVQWMESLSHQLGNRASSQSGTMELPVFKVALRNVIFTLVVLLHGFRRLFPPY